jgi:hypothetical protein
MVFGGPFPDYKGIAAFNDRANYGGPHMFLPDTYRFQGEAITGSSLGRDYNLTIQGDDI